MRILVADDDRVMSQLICTVPSRMRELGALDVLPKPVDPQQLLDAVDRAVGRAVA